MGRARALGLLVVVLLFSLAVAGCLGGPSDEEIDLDALPSEYGDPPQGTQAPADAQGDNTGEQDPQDPPATVEDPTQQEPAPGANTTDTNGTSDEDEQGLESYTGPEAVLRVRNSTGEPTRNAMATAPFDAHFYVDAKLPPSVIPYWSLRLTGSDKPLAEGNTLPVEINHTIIPPGTHTAVLFVSDGMNRDEERIQINLNRPPPPPSILFEGTITGFWVPENYIGDSNAHGFELKVPVKEIRVNLTTDTTAVDLDFELVAPDGTTVERRAGINEPTGTLYPAQEPDIVVTNGKFTNQLGEWVIYVEPALSAIGDYQVTVTFS